MLHTTPSDFVRQPLRGVPCGAKASTKARSTGAETGSSVKSEGTDTAFFAVLEGTDLMLDAGSRNDIPVVRGGAGVWHHPLPHGECVVWSSAPRS